MSFERVSDAEHRQIKLTLFVFARWRRETAVSKLARREAWIYAVYSKFTNSHDIHNITIVEKNVTWSWWFSSECFYTTFYRIWCKEERIKTWEFCNKLMNNVLEINVDADLGFREVAYKNIAQTQKKLATFFAAHQLHPNWCKEPTTPPSTTEAAIATLKNLIRR